MIDTLYQDSTDKALDDLVTRPTFRPPQSPGFSVWGTLVRGPVKGVGAGVAEKLASDAELVGAYGQVQAALPYLPDGMFAAPTPQQKAEQDKASKRLMTDGIAFSNEAGDMFRQRAHEIMPDPMTTHASEQVVANLTRFGAKAVSYGVGGPSAPVRLAVDEGLTEADRLKQQGVDEPTRTKAGAVSGTVAGASIVLPVAAATKVGTAALIGVAGPGGYVAQTAAEKAILEHAGYDKIASQYDPFDPVALALSTAVPAVFGAAGYRGRAQPAPANLKPLADMSLGEKQKLAFNDTRLDAYAVQAAEREGIPPEALLAVKNAGEKSASTATSPKGARGVMQFIPETWKAYGQGDITDPVASIDAGARFMSDLIKQYGGDVRAAIAHYNGGGKAGEAVRAGVEPPAAETRGYLQRADEYMGAQAGRRAAADPEAVAAARVRQTADALDGSRLSPDGDLAGAQAHYDAIARAHDQLAAGERVDVTDIVARGGLDPERVAAIGRNAEGLELAENLSPAERGIEMRLADKVLNDYEGARSEYAANKETAGGKILNTDIARELSPDYLRDRTQSAAVHEPASHFVKKLYADRLKSMQPGDRIVFTSGGTGAGKTTAIANVPAAQHLVEMAHTVYDTNMNTMGSAVKKVDQALAAGANVHILHVQRDPVEALVNGALPRAMRQEAEFGSGRTVPLTEHARTHRGAAQVIQQLAERYKDDPRVDIQIIDNTRGKGAAQLSDLGFVRSFDYNGLEGKLHEALNQEHDAGRVSEAVARATAGDDGKGNGPLLRSDGAGEPEQQRAGSGPGGPAEGPSVAGGAGEVAPAQAALDRQAAEVLSLHPDLLVQLDGMDAPARVGDLLAEIQKQAQNEAKDGDLLQAAANCFLRNL